MTGAGKASVQYENKTINIFIKSVNSKQLDVSAKLPYIYRERELELRALIAEQVGRGKVDLSVSIDEQTGTQQGIQQLNEEVLTAYFEQAQHIAHKLNITPPSLDTLIALPGVISTQEAVTLAPSAEEHTALREALLLALSNLNNFREQEGGMLQEVLSQRIHNIRELLAGIEQPEQERIPAIRERLEEALARLDSEAIDRGRLEQELIYYIDKLDINEEKDRLSHHLGYFLEVMNSHEGQQGKTLGFIAQEIGREINTLGSKSNNAPMQQFVIKMKDELEQIKEQVLNVL